MNFYDNMMSPMMINPNFINDINYKINELENNIKKLNERIERLESIKNDNLYNNKEDGLYMI